MSLKIWHNLKKYRIYVRIRKTPVNEYKECTITKEEQYDQSVN